MGREEGVRRGWVLGWLALPVAVFYAVLLALAVNLPLYDDYDVGLGFANRLTSLPAGTERLLYFAAAQQNEYKTYLGHAFVWAELAGLGHLEFRLLSVAGDLFVLLLIWVLWRMFLPGEGDRTRRLLLFVPVPFLVFQLGYWETLNWPLPGLQNLPVVGFALLTIFLLGRRTDLAFWGAATAMLLAIAASGNGFLLLPIGLAMLVLGRRWAGVAGWLATGAAAAAVYAYRYTPAAPRPGQGSMMAGLLHPKVMYVVAFLGAAGSFPVRSVAYPLGVALVGFVGWMAWRGYPRRNPVVCWCVVFVLLTAWGVAGIRTDGGLLQSTSSRYRIYSDVLLVLAWFAVAEEFLQGAVVRSRGYRWAVGLAALFWLGNTAAGVRALHMRDGWMRHGMALYEHPELRTGADGPVYIQPVSEDAGWVRFELQARRVLDQARASGVYEPPQY